MSRTCMQHGVSFQRHSQQAAMRQKMRKITDVADRFVAHGTAFDTVCRNQMLRHGVVQRLKEGPASEG